MDSGSSGTYRQKLLLREQSAIVAHRRILRKRQRQCSAQLLFEIEACRLAREHSGARRVTRQRRQATEYEDGDELVDLLLPPLLRCADHVVATTLLAVPEAVGNVAVYSTESCIGGRKFNEQKVQKIR